MGNQLCTEDGLETTSYKVKSRTSGIQMIQRTQWYQPQFKQEETGTPILSLTVRSRLQALGNFTYDHNGIVGQYFKTSKFIDSNTIYSGQWANNKPHGKGKLYFPDGSYFEGTFKEGKTHGKGRFIEFNGNYFEGTLMNNQPQGEGIHNDFDGVYQGQFKQGKANGIGSYRGKGIYFKGTFVNGDKRQGQLVWGENNQYVYKGNLISNLFHGKGVLTSTSGKYEGNFEKGQKSGYGTYYWNDGRKYTGMYQNDKKNGYGQLYDPKGHPVYKGVWRDDEIAGDGVSFKKNSLQNSYSNHETASMF